MTKLHRKSVLILTIILGWTLGFGLWSAWRTSMTMDEGIHTASAYLALQRNDFRFDPEHPPLFRYLTALPLFSLDLNLPNDDQKLWDASAPTMYDSWVEARRWADQWVYESGNDAQLMMFLARLPAVAVLLALVFFTYLLVRKLWGDGPALWSAFFISFSPTFLGHGVLTNTDVPLALCYVLATYTLLRYYHKPSLINASIVGISIGIALTVKHSAVALVPIALTWLFYVAYINKLSWKTVLAHLGASAVVTWVIIWVVYGFNSPIRPNPSELSDQSQMVYKWLAERGLEPDSFLNIVRWILPIDYVKGLILAIGGSVIGRPTFLLGQELPSGVWYFFPVSFLLKTQLIAIILGLFALLRAIPKIIKRPPLQPVTILFLLITAVLGYSSITSNLNLGIRHITPLLWIFSIVLGLTMARICRGLQPFGFLRVTIPVLLVVAYAYPVLAQRANLIGFSNELITPASNGYRYFNDSNLDWNGGMKDIADAIYEEARSYGDTVVYINCNEIAHIQYFLDKQERFFNRIPPTPVSFTKLPDKGLVVVMATQRGLAEAKQDPTYEPLRGLTPTRIIPNIAYFYRL